MNSKLEEALNLSEEILNQLEDANVKTSVIALKCLRLARLMDDYESVDWLVCEMEGYKSTKDGIPHDLFELGAKHGRERKNDKGERILFTELSSELELLCESSQKSIGSYTTEGVSVAGEFSHVAMNNLLNSVTRNNTGTINVIKESQKKLSILRGEYYRYAMNINIQLKFSEKIESIFDDYRTIVDKYLADNLPTGTRKLSSIYSRLKEKDEESFKLYYNDVGLLYSCLFMNHSKLLTDNNLRKSLLENDIANTLIKLGYNIYYYQTEAKAEVEFIIQNKLGKIIPIELTSTKSSKSKILSTFNDKFNIKEAIKITEDNFIKRKNTRLIPVYAICCLKDL